MELTPFGAAETVTGSCHLLEHQGYKLLLDCGAYQGSDEEKNEESFGFEPAHIDAVVLSHAHNDHIGRLPQLVRQGFRGRVYATEPTRLILPVILEDSLRLQQEERARLERKGRPVPPLQWDEADLKELYTRLANLEIGPQQTLGPLELVLHTAGHLPGSAFIEARAGGKKLVFSGDLGHQNKEVLPNPDLLVDADWVLCEGTYGDRSHRPFDQTIEEFAKLLNQAFRDGGKVFIPSFALERTQEILFYLRDLEESRQIPSVPVFVDSPMAAKISDIYPKISGFFSPEVQALYAKGLDPFGPARLEYTHSVEDSKALNALAGPMVIIAGNGMLSGGRILHHLRNGLPNAKNMLVIIGYQPRGGLGRMLIDGVPSVKLFGEEVRVRASTHTIGGFSGHAGQDELLHWLEHSPSTALVHGELDKLEVLQSKLKDRQKAFIGQWGKPLVF
jgi:metallo-beta-lactamase family protein